MKSHRKMEHKEVDPEIEVTKEEAIEQGSERMKGQEPPNHKLK